MADFINSSQKIMSQQQENHFSIGDFKLRAVRKSRQFQCFQKEKFALAEVVARRPDQIGF